MISLRIMPGSLISILIFGGRRHNGRCNCWSGYPYHVEAQTNFALNNRCKIGQQFQPSILTDYSKNSDIFGNEGQPYARDGQSSVCSASFQDTNGIHFIQAFRLANDRPY